MDEQVFDVEFADDIASPCGEELDLIEALLPELVHDLLGSLDGGSM